MSPLGLVLFFVVGCLLLTLLERMNEPTGCVLCGGKREHHPSCSRRDR